jgi:hypothetical protein
MRHGRYWRVVLQAVVRWRARLNCTVSRGCKRPILLKNSVSADDGKNSAPVGREGRGKLGAYREELMSRCRAYSLLQQRTMDQILDQMRI